MTAKFPLVSRSRFEELHKRFDVLSEHYKKIAAERDNLRVMAMTRKRAFAEQMLTDLARTFNLTRLQPIATCRTEAEWSQFCASPLLKWLQEEDGAILAQHQFDEEWEFAGYSSSACRIVNFKVDNLWGGRREENQFIPNIRERLVCPISGLNNRQRLIASLVSADLLHKQGAFVIYIMEQITDIYRWISTQYSNYDIIGSEYLGDDFAPGQIVDGIRHEDIHRLSFANSSIDLIVSNEVMEHVPWPRRAFREIARVLRPGGQALMTFPFTNRSESVVRAELVDGSVVHRLEPVYHGNPLSAEGSLVFTDFGWDLMELMRVEGFRDAALEIYHSAPAGHLGLGTVFRLIR